MFEEIEIDRICPNEDNFYSMNKDDIDFDDDYGFEDFED